ncbi:MAG: ABC transporter permease [Thermotogae bacterium]|uniref:Transport permease protein n=1 Tax=Kosmotoga arenicorallina TaxID=688066 RepID=A0A7C5HY97_9BACT|nr:ABC transporter permease [Kosmotoga sp.]MBO8166932.1 ABC transporter permease [Kosmotoga sp.]RKX47907.1 MAG: ABC transporter permease [Thermotogota bacterium]HHF08613.1 ABC transporter permease [Kosmotoga arenicorallina]
MKYALQIAFKDLKYFFRSRIAIFAFLIMPIFMMLMTGYIFPKMQSGANVKVAVYSLDSGFRKMMENKKTENFIFVDSEEELKQFLLDEKADVAMVIPEGFLSAMLKKQEIKVRLIPSPSNPQMAMAAAQGITASIGGSIGNMNDKFTLEMENPGGGEFNYYSFMAPGIMAMVAIMSVVNGLAAAITTEKERGTLDGILTTPIPRYSIVLGKTLAQGIRGILQAIIILLIAVFLFGATVQGSILLALFVLVLGIMSFIGVGIIITAGAPDQETSQMILTTLMFPMMFLSGVFFPVNQMPSFMQSISKFFPLTYAAEALRKVMVLGGTFQNISGDVIILLIFSVITFSLAVPLFGKLTTT